MAVDLDIHSKTEVLLEALPYIQQFRGSVFVVKFGGSFMATEQARVGVATDLVFLAAVGIRVVVVHGGGPAINRAMERACLEPTWRNGLRVTNAATMEIVERTLNTEINADICGNIGARGGDAAGIAGQQIFKCVPHRPLVDGAEVDLGYVGEVVDVDRAVVEAAFADGKLPVISPVGRGADGEYYNCNADTAASALAAAVGARRLVYLCDVPGLLRDPKEPASLMSTLKRSEVDGLCASGVIGTGMLPKVASAVKALEGGVHRVHFIDGRMAHSILLEIFTDRGVGTEIIN